MSSTTRQRAPRARGAARPAEPVSRVRAAILAALAVTIGLGIALKFYRGPGAWWINDWGPASVPYEMCLMLAAFFCFPRRPAITPIAIGVCLTTCALELAQLWHPPWLEQLRASCLGRALLGNTFSWCDLPAYPVGCLVGWFVLRRLARIGERPAAPASAP